MPADASDPGARLVLPEGYVAELSESGQLDIYSAETRVWVCEVNPNISNAQKMVDVLLTAHENEVLHIMKDPYS